MKYIFISILAISLFSCSKDNVIAEPTGDLTPFSVPLNTGNTWTYIVEDGTTTSSDELYINGDIIIGGQTYKEFKVVNDVSTGFYCRSLQDNAVRKDGNKLLLTGDLSLGAGSGLPTSFNLSLLDFIIFNASAIPGDIQSQKSDVINQTVSGFPLTINYTLKSIGGNNIGNYTAPNNDTYASVRTTKIVLTASITTTLPGVPFPITVLQEQDVVVSTQYVAENIGVVHTNTVTSYDINTTFASSLGIPATSTQTQTESLDTYNVN